MEWTKTCGPYPGVVLTHTQTNCFSSRLRGTIFHQKNEMGARLLPFTTTLSVSPTRQARWQALELARYVSGRVERKPCACVVRSESGDPRIWRSVLGRPFSDAPRKVGKLFLGRVERRALSTSGVDLRVVRFQVREKLRNSF